jgi:hypothetical protein
MTGREIALLAVGSGMGFVSLAGLRIAVSARPKPSPSGTTVPTHDVDRPISPPSPTSPPEIPG